jgi:hypothetical protein
MDGDEFLIDLFEFKPRLAKLEFDLCVNQVKCFVTFNVVKAINDVIPALFTFFSA